MSVIFEHYKQLSKIKKENFLLYFTNIRVIDTINFVILPYMDIFVINHKKFSTRSKDPLECRKEILR